ncbi:uncharacterized protein LOC133297817 isoform X2 [Gastrolobium bilobum]|uniref:uncharacterized protein LOC133297817 isoform X2 n=1 Tax=Gastrolobium bilobum TaxID=150636 RepID=UPI002AAFBBC7|nr:uncharacterized protein LOC133297817 isoform X2 [Gastrolobium bilobum]
MEPAKIDWKRVEWNFMEDELYEHINAPKWFDFLSPAKSLHDHDDEAWFCKPDCKHPKTAEDFLRSTTPSKDFSPAYVSENFPYSHQNRRDAKIKRRVPALSSASPQDDTSRFNQDSENHNPNLFTPPIKPLQPIKEAIKSSEEKKRLVDDNFHDNKVPSLRSTLSTKNLFAGRPILNQITEFCNELKRMATRPRERDNAENLSPIESEAVMEKTPHSLVQALAESHRREKERKPLLVVCKAERLEDMCVKGKQQRKKRPDEAENMPMTLDLENLRHKRDESLQQIRTNPPSPQCFSATRGLNKITPSKASSKSQLMERAILEEVEQNKEIVKESCADNSRSIAIVDGRETKALDMFWFLKPCTL